MSSKNLLILDGPRRRDLFTHLGFGRDIKLKQPSFRVIAEGEDEKDAYSISPNIKSYEFGDHNHVKMIGFLGAPNINRKAEIFFDVKAQTGYIVIPS